MYKARKYLVFPTPLLFDASAQGEPVGIYTAKTIEGLGYLW